MDKLELKALGKINLGLDVLGRRENGYHDVRMVMQTLYLYDNVSRSIRIFFICRMMRTILHGKRQSF